MLRPEYLNKGEENNPPKSSNQEPNKINPKLKQCFEIKNQIKPFYSGGKIVVLKNNTTLCQYGPRVNLVRYSSSVQDDSEQSLKQNFSIPVVIEAELDDIISFDACPFAEVVVTAHKSNLLRVWTLDGVILKTIKSLHTVPIISVDINKKSLADQSSESDEIAFRLLETQRLQMMWITVAGASVKLWKMGGNLMSKVFKIDNIASIGYVCWSPYSNTFLVAERNIYVMKTGDEGSMQIVLDKTLEGHYSQVTGITFLNKSTMISAGRDKVVVFWNIEENYTKTKTISMTDSIEGVLLSRPSDLFIAVNPSNIFRFDVGQGLLSKIPVLQFNEQESFTGFHSFPENPCDSSIFVTTHIGSIYEISLIKNEDESKNKNISLFRQYVGDLDEILCVSLWIDSKVVVANNTAVIKVYDMEECSCTFLRGHKDIVLTVQCQDETMASGSKDNTIIIWKVDSPVPKTILSGHLSSVTGLCFSSKQMILYSVAEDNFLKMWDEKRLLRSNAAHDKEINCVHCSPNGALVVTASRDRTVKVWDADSLRLVCTLKGHKKGVWDAKFSEWDQIVATASADTTIKLWSLISHECMQTLQGHLSSVLQLQFINLGLQLVSVSSDGSLKAWEIKTSNCVTTEECGDGKIWAMHAVKDGSALVTGSADGMLSLWCDVTEQKFLEMVEKKKKLIEDEQQLNNFIAKDKWLEAFTLSLSLKRPHTLLKVIREVTEIAQLLPVIKGLSEDQLRLLLDYVSQWNTNTKSSTEAQIILNIILFTFPHKDIAKMIDPINLLAYTEKHHDRFTKIYRQVNMFDLVVKNPSYAYSS